MNPLAIMLAFGLIEAGHYTNKQMLIITKNNAYLSTLAEITTADQAFKAGEETRLRNIRTTGRADGNWRDTLWRK